MYYLVVYLQLVLLTPWLFRLLDRPAARAALYAATPATLAVRYALSVAGLSLGNVQFLAHFDSGIASR